MTTIERMVWEVRRRAEVKIFRLLNSSLAMEHIQKLNCLLLPMEDSTKTYLAWLREIPSSHSPILFSK